MKKIIFLALIASTLTACKPTLYSGNFGQVNQTQVVLSNANFKVLGSFSGTVTENKMTSSVKDREGIISQAKRNLLANAKAKGIELTGSRTLTSVCVDVVQNSRKVTVTVSAEIIEFTN